MDAGPLPGQSLRLVRLTAEPERCSCTAHRRAMQPSRPGTMPHPETGLAAPGRLLSRLTAERSRGLNVPTAA